MRQLLFPLLLVAVPAAAQPLLIGTSTTPENCTESNGTAQAWASGGQPPYSFNWSNGGTTDLIMGLAAGSYDVTVTDNMGTQQMATAVVPNVPNIGFTGGGTFPASEMVTGYGIPCEGMCNGGFALPMYDGYLGGMPPYTVQWVDQSIVPNGNWTNGDPIFFGFCAGADYDYTVTDALGCSSAGNTGAIYTLDSASAYWTIDSVRATACVVDSGAVYFSQQGIWPSDVTVYLNGIAVDSLTGTTQTQSRSFTGLAPGQYIMLHEYNVSACEQTLSFTIPEIGSGCGTVSGIIFHDADHDCSHDLGESGIPYQLLLIEPGSLLAITGSNGQYIQSIPTGNFTIEQLATDIVPLCPLPQPVPFNANGGNAIVDFADSVEYNLDIGLYAWNNAARPGFNTMAYVTVRNLSAYWSGPITLTCTISDSLTVLGSFPAGGVVNGHTITWILPPLAPYAEFNAGVGSNVPLTVPIGTVLTTAWTVSNGLPDVNPVNDVVIRYQTVTGSYDPNDKTAFTSSGLSTTDYLIAQDEYIDYVIRFQNTGTDTAFTVVVTDTLAAELDMSSFEQGVASHPFTVAFKPGRVVEWRFENILLADSNTNEPASHGAIGFLIQPVLPVLPGTLLENEADIFFDFNAPVRTNTSTLLASSGMGANEARTQHAIVVFPNPANDQLTVVANGFTPSSVRIISADGRSVQYQRTTSERVEVDIVALNAGAYIVEVVGADGTAHRQRVIVR